MIAGMEATDLLAAALDIERHVAADGWDQPPLLFALVPTARIRAEQPDLAARLGVTEGGPALTSFEQDRPPADTELDEFLGGIEWPDPIVAAAVVLERIVLPPDAEAEVLAHPDVTTAAHRHPAAQEMRIVVAASRDGRTMCALRLRGHDDESVLTGADLVPGLAEALLATFR